MTNRLAPQKVSAPCAKQSSARSGVAISTRNSHLTQLQNLAETSSRHAALDVLQRVADAQASPVAQRWVKKPVRSETRTTMYVATPSEPVFKPDVPENATVFGELEKRLPLGTELDVTEASRAPRDGAAFEYSEIITPPKHARRIIKLDSLSEENPKAKENPKAAVTTEPGLDALSATTELTTNLDPLAGAYDRGIIKGNINNDGWKDDRNPSQYSEHQWDTKHGSEIASGVGGSISDFIGFVKIVRSFKDRDAGEKAEGAFDLAATGTSLVSNVTMAVDSSAKAHMGKGSAGAGNTINFGGGTRGKGSYETSQSDAAGKITGNVADAVGVVASIKDLIISARDAFRTFKKSDKASSGEKVHGSIDVLMNTLGVVKSIVTTARNLQFTLENAFHSGVSAAVPGLGLAMAGIQALVHSYDTLKSMQQYHTMKVRKRQLKDEIDDELLKVGVRDVSEKGVASKSPLRNKKKRGRNKEEIMALVPELESEILSIGAEGEKCAAKEIAKREAIIALIRKYQIAQSFEYVNAKTSRRGVANIILDLTTIAGEIATLSVVGAGGGAAVKVAAGATKGAMIVGRHLKQFGNNQAAKEGASSLTKKIFNAEKSSDRKLATRRIIADFVFDQVVLLGSYVYQVRSLAPDGNEVSADYDKMKALQDKQFFYVRDTIRAAGYSWKAWSAICADDPSKGYEMIVEGQKTRD